jgi:hypothetical protein
MLFFFPLGRPATWRMAGMRPTVPSANEHEQEALEPSLADLQAIAVAFTGGSLRLRDPVWLTYFRLHHRHATRYRAGRVFLAGDAAHVHSPAGAQGMNTGIQDAWNLGWKLALVSKGVADEALLDSYEAERRPVGRLVLRFTDRATRIATSPSPLLRLLRTQVVPRLAPLALRSKRGRSLVYRTLSQLAIRYRHSPAVEEGQPAPRRGPKACERLPDARIARDGQTSWLQEALATPTVHLLLCGSPLDWDGNQVAALQDRYAGLVSIHRLAREPAPGVLHDVDGQAFARLGVERAAHFLVRPDGYVAYRSGGPDLNGLERYLARWFPGAAAATSPDYEPVARLAHMRSSLPLVACSLDAADQPKRLAEWAELLRRARTREETPTGVRYTFAVDEGLKLHVEALAADEHSCCSFLAFEVIEGSDELEMTVTAPPNGQEALRLIFA